MSLKNKVIAILLCVFGVYAIVEFTVQRAVLLPVFMNLERTAAAENVDRAIHALQREVQRLSLSAADWASRKDLDQSMGVRNATQSRSSLDRKILKSLKADFIAFYDGKGRPIWTITDDSDLGKHVHLPEFGAGPLPSGHFGMQSPILSETIAGLHRGPAGIVAVAARPVSIPYGRILIARLIDKTAVEELGVQAGVKLSIAPVTKDKPFEPQKADANSGIRHTPIVYEDGDDVCRASTSLLNMSGIPIAAFQVETPRNITIQGRNALTHALLIQIIAGGTLLLMRMIFLQKSVFDPVSRLTRHAIAVGRYDDLNARLQMNRTDEIGTLAHELDRMVERLSKTRRRLLDQSYKAGIAEMASGALHNIGNAITPIGVKLIHLKNELRQAPVTEMAQAAAELANPATPADRRTDLAQFAELAGREVTDMIIHTTSELETIRGQIDHVQMILADKQRFSRTQRIIEPIAIYRLVEETSLLQCEELHRVMAIKVDGGLSGIGNVSGARIALQQVVGNLLINAAESIREHGSETACGKTCSSGWMRIYSVAADPDNPGFAHICFEDNGKGIASEHLPHIFERGFSTKARGSGMGLHWCANTVSTMGGRLYAENPGPGRGACIHLVLPLATSPKHNVKDAA